MKNKTLKDSFIEDPVHKYGFVTHYVFDAANLPPGYVNIHTHGFDTSWKSPDIQVVLSIGEKNAHAIFWQIADKVKDHWQRNLPPPYKVGMDYDDIVKGFKTRFIEARENNRPVLRLVVPDPKGNLDEKKMEPFYRHQYHYLNT